MTATVVVLTKVPRPGTVKTRLGLPGDEAAALHAAMVDVTLTHAASSGLDVVVCLDGPFEHPWTMALRRRGVALEAQGSGDLGQRLRRAFDRDGRTVAIGTDCPTLDPRWLVRAATAADRVALGPAEDGGYWLVAGTRSDAEVLFDGIPWSTSAVLACTLRNLRAANTDPVLLPTCYDIDGPDDLDRLASDPACPPPLRPFLARSPHAARP